MRMPRKFLLPIVGGLPASAAMAGPATAAEAGAATPPPRRTVDHERLVHREMDRCLREAGVPTTFDRRHDSRGPREHTVIEDFSPAERRVVIERFGPERGRRVILAHRHCVAEVGEEHVARG